MAVIGAGIMGSGIAQLAATAGLGTDLVVQMPYGDSGKTTFFIKSAADFDACAICTPI